MALASLALCSVGLLVSAYLTVEHFSSSIPLACPNRGALNCAKVTASSYSYVFAVPVAPLGLPYFAALAALSLPAAWRTALPVVRWSRLAAVTSGAAFVVYLVWAELFRINALCIWCTVVHAATVGLFTLAVLAEAAWEAPDAWSADGARAEQSV